MTSKLRSGRARRVDANTKEIVKALRAVGATVIVANSEVDLIVGHCGTNHLMEVKASEKAPLKPSQQKLVETWRGCYSIVHSPLEALRVLGVVDS